VTDKFICCVSPHQTKPEHDWTAAEIRNNWPATLTARLSTRMVQWCKDGFPMLPFNTAPHHPNKMLTQHHAKVRKALCTEHLEVSEQHLDDVIFLMNPI
jgi:hypothetical protein